MATQNFIIGETVECWRHQGTGSAWKVATIVSASVDSRNRRAYRYTVDWEDKTDRSNDIQAKLIRKLTINFSPNVIEHSDVLHPFEQSNSPHPHPVEESGE